MAHISFPALIESTEIETGQDVQFADHVMTIRDADGRLQPLRANAPGNVTLIGRPGDVIQDLDATFTITPAQARQRDNPPAARDARPETEDRGLHSGGIIILLLLLVGMVFGGWYAIDNLFGQPSPPPVIDEARTIALGAWGRETGSRSAQELRGISLEKRAWRLGLSADERVTETTERFVLGRVAGDAYDMLRETEEGFRMERWEVFGNKWEATRWFERDISPFASEASWVGFSERADGGLIAWMLNATTLYGLDGERTITVPLSPAKALHFDRDASFHVKDGAHILIGLPSSLASTGSVLHWQDAAGSQTAEIAQITTGAGIKADGIQLLSGGQRPRVLLLGSKDGQPWWAEYEISGTTAREIHSATLPRPGNLDGSVHHMMEIGKNRIFVIARTRSGSDAPGPSRHIEEFYVGRWKGRGPDMEEIWGKWWRMTPPMPGPNRTYSARALDLKQVSDREIAILFRTRVRSTITRQRFDNFGIFYVNLDRGYEAGIAFFDGDFDEDFVPAGMTPSEKGLVVYGGRIYNQFGPEGEDATLEGNQRAGWFEVWK